MDSDWPTNAPATVTDALVRLSSVQPFIGYLKARRLSVADSLGRFALTEDSVKNPERMVHAEVVYGLLNEFAKLAKDPHLGVHVAETVRLSDWVFAQHVGQDHPTLVGALITMVESVPSYGQSVRHVLQIGSKHVSYSVSRPNSTRNKPSQADGLGAALFVILFDLLDSPWNPEDVAITTHYPEAIPEGYRGLEVTRTEKRLFKVIFPTEWCHRRLDLSRPLHDQPRQKPEQLSIVRAMEAVAPARFVDGTTDLRSAIAADLGLDAKGLDHSLTNQGTSFSREISAFRLRLARTALTETDAPVSEIAHQLGFSAAANFTRFFKAQTGTTPRAYRKSSSRGG